MLKHVEKYIRNAGVPAAAIALINGDSVIVEAVGVRRAGTTEPVTPDTSFDTGSCSKGFVSAAIACLISDGKLTFEDPVWDIVPEFQLDKAEFSQELRIRDLLSNRLGLKRQLPVESFANPDIDVVEVLSRVRHLERIRPFRKGYVYFNPAFMAARVIVERISGLGYEEFLAERLFTPLGMTASASGCLTEALPERATGHIVRDRVATALEDIPRFDNWQGAAGVYCSIRDAAKWLRFHIFGKAENGTAPVSPEVLAELHRPQTPMPLGECKLIHCPPEAQQCRYCMGWWETTLGGHRLVQHAGEMFGWRAQFAFLPEMDVGVAIMLSAAVDLHAAASYSILQATLGERRDNWWQISVQMAAGNRRNLDAIFEHAFACNPGAPSTLELEAYAGDYRNAASGVARVSVHKDRLQLSLIDGRIWDSELRHLGGDVFEVELLNAAVQDYMPTPARLRFNVESGTATSLQDVNSTFDRVGVDSDPIASH